MTFKHHPRVGELACNLRVLCKGRRTEPRCVTSLVPSDRVAGVPTGSVQQAHMAVQQGELQLGWFPHGAPWVRTAVYITVLWQLVLFVYRP